MFSTPEITTMTLTTMTVMVVVVTVMVVVVTVMVVVVTRLSRWYHRRSNLQLIRLSTGGLDLTALYDLCQRTRRLNH